MENEIWKPVVGYEGLYSVSSLGRVRSETRIDASGHLRNCRILKTSINTGGYLCCVLYKNGIGKSVRVHRLVAEAFIPNPNNLPMINHKSEIKTDNRVENLEFCDNKYNSNYGGAIERRVEKQSKRVNQYTLDGKYVATYPSTHEASRQTGIDQSNIVKNIKGKYPYAGNYIWRYKENEAA